MPSSSNINTAGMPISNITVSNIGISSGFVSGNFIANQRFKARVTGVDISNGHIYFETNINNFNKSELGAPNLKNIARPLDIYNIRIPIVGEIIEIIPAPEATGLSANKNTYNNIPYYDKILNTWDNINGNKVLDNTVPNQINESQMANINQTNINKSIILGGI
jgi:hypothetical protein